jgi:hypothetical protein
MDRFDKYARSPQAALRQMIDGYRVSQLICVAAELGIADLLKEGPRHYEDLATATNTTPRALWRVLRALSSIGVFAQAGADRFALTALAEVLRTGVPGSQRSWARVTLGQLYPVWARLDHNVRTGETAFDHLHGVNVWQHRDQDGNAGQVFNEAMSAFAAMTSRAVLGSYDFSAFRTVVDVGGGNGTLEAALLEGQPQLRAVLLDLPTAIENARSSLAAAGVADRCELVEGSFFDSVPPGGDIYILSRVLHDWQDEQAMQILRHTREAMKPQCKLLIVERIMDSQNPDAEVALSDISMMVMNGGRERSEREFRVLLESTGFELARVVATQSPVQLIEAIAL